MLLPLLALLPEPDLTTLEQQAEEGLTHLPGCFDVQAEVALSYRAVGIVRDSESYTLEGRIEDGVWTSLTPAMVDAGKENASVGFGEMPFVPPLFGTLEAGLVAEGPANLVAMLVASTRDEVGLNRASLDTIGADEVYVLHKDFSARQGRGDVQQRVWLRPTGEVLRARLHIDHARTEDGVVLRELKTEQNIDAAGRPSREQLSLKLRAGPMTMRLYQDLNYTSWAPCTGP